MTAETFCFDYDDNGNRSVFKYWLPGEPESTLVRINYSYNRDNMLKSYSNINGPTFSFNASQTGDIDGLGRLKSAVETIAGTRTHNLAYTYDMRSQLTSAAITNIDSATWTGQYCYKNNGDMDSRTIDSSQTTFTYTGNQMDAAAGGESFVLDYDDNGNMINGVASTLVYNWDNKLRSAAKGSDSISLKYDPLGNRIYKDSSLNGKRKYIVDIVSDLPVILMEIDPDNPVNPVKKTYIYANSQIIAQHDGDHTANRYFYQHDRLGSVRQVINHYGNVKNHYTYDPFGELFATEFAETVSNSFRFTGQYYDSEIKQYYLRARQYDPHLYRFTSRDPVFGEFQEPLSLHKYLYCINDPISWVDPDGREIRLGWARAIGRSRNYHTLLHIIPENQAAYFSARSAEFYDIDTMQMSFTIDAGPSDYLFFPLAHLEARLRGVNDNEHLDKASYGYCIVDLKDMDEDDVIASLINAYFGFKEKEKRGTWLNYDLKPDPGDKGYNSNSFISSLLNAVYLDNDRPPVRVPGWDKIIDPGYFIPNN